MRQREHENFHIQLHSQNDPCVGEFQFVLTLLLTATENMSRKEVCCGCFYFIKIKENKAEETSSHSTNGKSAGCVSSV